MIVLEGNGARPSHSGIGWCESDVMYTLNATEVHCVCFDREPSGRLKSEDNNERSMSDLERSDGDGGGIMSPW